MLKPTKKRAARTTFSYHRFHKYPNIIRDKTAQKAGEIIVSDITYIWVENIENFAYLFLITDLYSRKIIGYCLSGNLRANPALKALKMALRQLRQPEGCIHHSDRGIQYCCHDYTEMLSKNKMLISMTENGDPLENAVAERVNKTIKEEFTNEKTLSFKSFDHGLKEMPKIIKFYNGQRPHRSIEMLTPSQAFTMAGELKRLWRFYPRPSKTESLVEGEFL
jgi:transposase InsO family protein